MDKNTKICVIYGGMSAEREVSLKSGKNSFTARPVACTRALAEQ